MGETCRTCSRLREMMKGLDTAGTSWSELASKEITMREPLANDKLKLERVENTHYTFDVERRWRGDDYVWCARIVFEIGTRGIRVTRGSLNLGELSALRLYDQQILANLVRFVEI